MIEVVENELGEYCEPLVILQQEYLGLGLAAIGF